MKPRKKNPNLNCPNDSGTPEEIRAFAMLILPIFECEWRREVTSPKPNWRYAQNLHQRMIKLEKGEL